MGTDTLKQCSICGEHKHLSAFSKHTTSKDGLDNRCKKCKNTKVNAVFNKKHNHKRMWVNGQYIPKNHPLWKAGRYRTFEDAAFSSLKNYKLDPKGDVYIISNPTWNGWVKVGKAVDALDRLNSYQTSSPFRDYVLNYKYNCNNRNTSEKKAHRALAKKFDKRNEWFYCTAEDAHNILKELL